ncbi:MAG: hypothetical protein QF795_05970, partial [Candidatus Marinimicrobia bacterium]|nr:hypothetical protein [Candidatus Neomarinimicrobiota bacterium]
MQKKSNYNYNNNIDTLENDKYFNFQNKFELENKLIKYFKEFHRISIIRTGYKGKEYPELTILDRTRNIFGYMVINNSNEKPNIEKLIKQIQIVYSELDRPLFYLYYNTNITIPSLHFTTSEIIHERMIMKMSQKA